MKIRLLILLLAPLMAFAQNAAPRKARFGLKIAPLTSWMKPEFNTQTASTEYKVENGGLRFGFTWGPSFEYLLNENFLLSSGVDINYISGRLEGRASSLTNTADPRIYDWKNTYNLRFVEIPLLLKGRTNELGPFRYYLNFGLSAGFRYRSNATFAETVGNSSSEIVYDDAKPFINNFRAALIVGGGLEYLLSGNTALVGGIQFNNGISNQLKNHGKLDPTDDFNKVTESGIFNYLQLNVGILF